MNEPSSITRPYWIHALTPLHVGSGRGIGFIDLPVMREAVTKWPLVPGSAVKGVLSDYHSGAEERLKKIAFGTSGTDYANSGSLVFTDARIVCLPIRSLFGTFAWCTSPLALERLRRDLDIRGLDVLKIDETVKLLVPSEPRSVLSDNGSEAFFEDLDFQVTGSGEAAAWAKAIADSVFGDSEWNHLFCERFAVLHDDIFNFLCETATQVDARVAIDDATKTVSGGALWYEESLPAETLLAGLLWCGPLFGSGDRNDATLRETLVQQFCTDAVHLQIGGKATVGRGQVRLVFSHGDSPAPETEARV